MYPSVGQYTINSSTLHDSVTHLHFRLTLFAFGRRRFVSSFHHGTNEGGRKDQEPGGTGRSPHSFDGLVGVLFSTIRHAYAPPVSLPERAEPGDGKTVGARASSDGSRNSFSHKSTRGHHLRRGRSLLHPGCDQGFGGGMLDLCLAEQCGSLLRELYKVLSPLEYGFASCLVKSYLSQ